MYKIGMPKLKPKKHQFTEKVQVLLSPELLRAAKAKAQLKGLPLSTYFRHLLLGDLE